MQERKVIGMPPKNNPDERDGKALAWADGMAEEDAEEGWEPTYRDGSLKNECWNDREWRDDHDR